MTEFEFMWLAFDSTVDDAIDEAAKSARTAMRNRHRAEKIALSKRHRFLLAEWYRVVGRAQPEHAA